jgi:hypothetical protein
VITSTENVGVLTVTSPLPDPKFESRSVFTNQRRRRKWGCEQQTGFTVVDVTKPNKPKVVNHVSQENLTLLNSGLALSETPDKSTDASPSHSMEGEHSGLGGSNAPESIRVLNISDPVHPRTLEIFDGVTSMVRDDAPSLLYVANGDGIWIVSHKQVLRRHLCSSSDAISSAIPTCT